MGLIWGGVGLIWAGEKSVGVREEGCWVVLKRVSEGASEGASGGEGAAVWIGEKIGRGGRENW